MTALDFSATPLFRSRRLLLAALLTVSAGVGLPNYMRGANSSAAALTTPQISVVDIMPEALSGETANDSEPDVAVNPTDPSQIAASALTRDPMGATTAPIFISTDSGQTWSCQSIVPSRQVTCDITLGFGTTSGVLYVSAIRNQLLLGEAQGKPNELVVCKTGGFASAQIMDEMFTRQGEGIDQPYIAAWTVAGKDHVFVGDKDYNYTSTPFKNGLAAINRSLDGLSNGSFAPLKIESRNLYGDNCEVRPAATADGKVVYVAFNHLTTKPTDYDVVRTGDVVVVRDDKGGASRPPFSSLKDPRDGLDGIRVKNRTFAWDKCLGGDRLGGDLAIAVHPTNSSKVYLVWSDWVNDHANLHLKCSTDGGKKWSDNRRDITDAKNPALAVNTQGVVGFLYQQVVNTSEGYTWMTQFEQTTDDFKSASNPMTLAKFPVTDLPACPGPDDDVDNLTLGDYLQLMSVGNNFYGIFASSNVPDLSRFKYGVAFQRRNDLNNKKLLDLQGKEVAPSIDPFFFKVTE